MIDLYGRALASAGRTFAQFTAIYDWGCGCGRVMRYLPDVAPKARLYGSDIDAQAIAWMREHFPETDLRVNAPLPPLPYADGSFDLVLALSVLTHLDETYQDAWLAELRRVLRPGGIALLTVSSEQMWSYTLEHVSEADREVLKGMRARLDERGILFWAGDGWGQHFPDFYHTTFHLPRYIHDHWSRWFTVVGIEIAPESTRQDVVVLRRD